MVGSASNDAPGYPVEGCEAMPEGYHTSDLTGEGAGLGYPNGGGSETDGEQRHRPLYYVGLSHRENQGER